MKRFALALVIAPVAGCHSKPEPARRPSPIELSMVRVPEGVFLMGAVDGDSDEQPVHDVHVAAFTLGRTDVTVAEYRNCESAGVCTPTPAEHYCNEHLAGRDAHPLNCATWEQATTFCSWAEARLPTEAEWEYAAHGLDRRPYPWGTQPPGKQLCWDGPSGEMKQGQRSSTCEVTAHPAGASPFGALDMAGNVWQWTSDLWSDDYVSPRQGPKRVVRGGTWYSFDPADVRTTLRFQMRAGKADYGVGFRCAR